MFESLERNLSVCVMSSKKNLSKPEIFFLHNAARDSKRRISISSDFSSLGVACLHKKNCTSVLIDAKIAITKATRMRRIDGLNGLPATEQWIG